MFKFLKKETTIFDEQITRTLAEMDRCDPSSREFSEMLNRLERLTSLKAKAKWNVNWNTVAIIAGNCAMTLIVIAYEQNHVMGPRMKEFFIKPKLATD